MAQNPSNVIPDQLIVVEGGKQLVPAPSSGDSGKVLGVLNSDGDIGWTEDREGMAQQQADWAETDPSKVTYIAHKPSGQMAPASTSSDSGKVLKVDSQGAPVWGDAPAGIVEFDWSTVTLSDIEGAITAGKTPVMLYVPWDNAYTTKCSLQKIEHTDSGDNYVFVSTPEGFVDTPSTQSTSITRLIMMYDGSKGSDIRSVSAILSSSDGSVTMAQGVTSALLDLSVANPLPASTSADADKVLTVNSSGTPEWATAQGGGGGDWGRYTRYLRLDDPNDQTQWRSDTTIFYNSGEAMIGNYYNSYPLSELFARPNSTTGQIEPGFGWGCTYILSGLIPLVPPVGTIYDSLGTGYLSIEDCLENPEDPMMEYTRTLHKIPLTFKHVNVGTSNSNTITATEFSVVIPPLSTSIDPLTLFQINLYFHDPSSSRHWSVIPRTDVSNDIADKFKVYCTCIPSQYFTEVAIQS